MTFYEAALRVLESAGRPLHYAEITQQAVAQSLLSHVGKTPEQTMLSRLAAMAKRPRDRRVMVTAKDTFALVEWQLPEDLDALAQTGVPEANPEEDLPPLRPIERHPEARAENVRAVGRGPERKRHRDDDEKRRRRFPPISEVAYEVLSESMEPLTAQELIAQGRERELMGDEVSAQKVLLALIEDNQRRIDAERRPQFVLDQETSKLSLGRHSELPPVELQAVFAAALGIPMENGRPVLPKDRGVERGEALDEALSTALKTAVKDARRAMAKALRRRLAELEPGTFEKSVVRMLQGLGYREVKVAKRSKDGPLLTARKREGSVELRYAVRVARPNATIERRSVVDLRKDLGHYSAQVGLLVGAGDVRGEARHEAQSSGALVMLWCGEALAEKFFEAHAGVRVQHIELYEIDESFFQQAKQDADEAKARREERQRERRRDDERPPREPKADAADASADGIEMVSDADLIELPDAGEGEEAEGPDEGEGAAEAGATPEGQAGANGTGRRRRRRRRGRRGRGPRPDAAGAAAPAEAGAPAPESGAAPAAPMVAAPAEPPPPPPPSAPTSSEG